MSAGAFNVPYNPDYRYWIEPMHMIWVFTPLSEMEWSERSQCISCVYNLWEYYKPTLPPQALGFLKDLGQTIHKQEMWWYVRDTHEFFVGDCCLSACWFSFFLRWFLKSVSWQSKRVGYSRLLNNYILTRVFIMKVSWMNLLWRTLCLI